MFSSWLSTSHYLQTPLLLSDASANMTSSVDLSITGRADRHHLFLLSRLFPSTLSTSSLFTLSFHTVVGQCDFIWSFCISQLFPLFYLQVRLYLKSILNTHLCQQFWITCVSHDDDNTRVARTNHLRCAHRYLMAENVCITTKNTPRSETLPTKIFT